MSFIASLAAMGTSLAASGLGALGVSTAAGTIGAGVASGLGAVGAGALTGSALGAVTSAATGQDVGEGAGMGAMTGAIGGGLSAGLGALAPATSAGTNAATTVGSELGSDAAVKALQNSIPASAQGLSSPVATTAGENLLGQSASTFAPSYSSVAGSNTGNIVGSGIHGASTAGAISDFLPSSGTLGGNAAASNSGISAINNRLMTNQLGSQFASQIPETPVPVTTAEKIGAYAKENPGLVSTVGSMGSGIALNSMMAPDAPTSPFEAQKSRYRWTGPNNFRWNPTGYAAGGITDLDTYMSNAQNIPNPREVADPEGYGGSSMQMLAGGGFTGRLMDSVGNNLLESIPLAHAFGWDSASEIPLIGGLFNKPEVIATLTPEEKKKLMDMAATQPGQIQQPQQMAQGGIADLGGYATGGRPNLLNGAGDGVSDDIPASIAGKQPARLAAGEYVISSRIVSELGNGSTDAGAQRLDEMVKRIQSGRSKTIGKGKEYAKDTKPYKHLPA